MAHEKATVDEDCRRWTTDTETEKASPISTEPTATATVAATGTGSDTASTDSEFPNTLAIIGQGTPSSFELTVDGEIELADEARPSDVTVLSGTTVEGTVENRTVTFRFRGDLTDVTFVDRGITGLDPASAPNVHVDYDEPTQSRA
jgi:hypothetical protein